MVWVVMLGVAMLFVVGPATASPGALDPGFGSGGTVTTTIGSGSSQASALVTQPDGKIVAAGDCCNPSEFALARYNPDGTLDTSFGSGGTVTTAIGSQSDFVLALLLQSDGKIVAAGASYDGSEVAIALARYNPDGTLDTSFGAGRGWVTTPLPASGGGAASAIVQQPDGKYVIAGGTGGGFMLARYNPDGSLDTSFGSSGAVTTPIPASGGGGASAIAIQLDGKIVAAGGCCNPSDFALARYNPDGTPDTSFGTNGLVMAGSVEPGTGEALVLQPGGKIVVGGDLDGNFGLARFNTDGSLDTSFGSGGTVRTQIGDCCHAYGRALVQQQDGDLVLAGYDKPYGAASPQQFALARYHSDGSLDAGFGADGTVSTPIGTNGNIGDAVALEPDGTIVEGGFTEAGTTGNDQFALARYLVTSTLTVSKAGSGSGLVSSSPSGIDCGTTCSASSLADVPVSLTETPAVGSTFTGWAGGCSGTGGCQVQMSSDQSVTATFSLIPEPLTVTTAGSGSGEITSTPAGISCKHTCSRSFGYGTTVTLKAEPARGSIFKGWTGFCSGAGTCEVTMTQAHSTTAMFRLKPACIVPKVRGTSLKRAERRIKRAHCSTGRVTHDYSTVTKGLVISQRPRPKRHLRNRARVGLVVSKGRRR